MREMKDSGIEWIGQIPKDWKIIKGKYVLEYLQKPVKDDDGVITCFRDGEVTLRSNRREDGFTLSDKEIGYQGIDVGDLVVHGMDGFAGAIGISDSRGKASPVLNVFNSKYSKRYLMYYLRSMAFSNVFIALASGIRVRSCDLSWNKLANLPYPTTSYEEQTEIVRYIDSQCSEIDATAEDIQKEISLLEDYKKSVITEAVTKGLNPDAEMKDSGIAWIGEIPKGWKIIRLKYITNSIGDGLHGTPNYDDLGTIFFINGNNLGNRKISITEKTNRLTEKEYKKCGVLKLDKRTLLMSLNGTYGTLSMYDNEPIMLSKSVGYINVCNKETKEYLYYFLQSPLAQSQMKISLAGTTIANLSLATVRNLKICLPSICEQQQIADYLDSKCSEIDAIIADKKRQRGILAEYKKSLIYEYVTGKKEVPVHE